MVKGSGKKAAEKLKLDSVKTFLLLTYTAQTFPEVATTIPANMNCYKCCKWLNESSFKIIW